MICFSVIEVWIKAFNSKDQSNTRITIKLKKLNYKEPNTNHNNFDKGGL